MLLLYSTVESGGMLPDLQDIYLQVEVNTLGMLWWGDKIMNEFDL